MTLVKNKARSSQVAGCQKFCSMAVQRTRLQGLLVTDIVCQRVEKEKEKEIDGPPR